MVPNMDLKLTITMHCVLDIYSLKWPSVYDPHSAE